MTFLLISQDRQIQILNERKGTPRTVKKKRRISIQKPTFVPGCDFPTEMGQLVLNKKKLFFELSALLAMKGVSAPILTVEKSLLLIERRHTLQFPLSCQHRLLSNRGTFIPPAVSNSLSVQPAADLIETNGHLACHLACNPVLFQSLVPDRIIESVPSFLKEALAANSSLSCIDVALLSILRLFLAD